MTPRSMQDAIRRVDEIACRDIALFKRVLASHDLGYADGYAEGKRHAYRHIGYVLALAALCAGIAWMVV